MHPSDLHQRKLLVFILAASLASTIGGLPFNALLVMLGSVAAFSVAAFSVAALGARLGLRRAS